MNKEQMHSDVGSEKLNWAKLIALVAIESSYN